MIPLTPNGSGRAFCRRFCTHAARGQYDEAAAEFAAQRARYATHRLLDLYLGVLDDPGRAMEELRRMADRFPDTPDGQGALAELRRRRDLLAQDQTQI